MAAWLVRHGRRREPSLIDDFEKLVADADAADLSGWGVRRWNG
jgi:hypothetical protein